MVYIEIVNNEVGLTHLKPFDEKDGLGKTREELEKTGLVLEAEPVAEKIEGKDAVLKYNAETKSLYFEYVDKVPIPKTEMEILQGNVNSLGAQLAQEKLKNMQKDTTIAQLGQEIAKLKLEVISIKGGI